VNALLTKLPNDHPYRYAAKLSLPVIFAYFPLGIVFSLVFYQLGFHWYFAPIMSFFVYSGAMQFVAIGILAAHGSYLSMIFATFFIAFRNSFYGLSFLKRFQVHWLKKAYLIFTLVDANYAIMMTHELSDKKSDEKFCLFLSFLVQVYWVSGSIVGAIFSQWLPNISGLEFVLACFFTVLVVEQYLKLRSFKPFLFTLGAGIAGYLLSEKNMLIIGICLSATVFLIYYGRNRA